MDERAIFTAIPCGRDPKTSLLRVTVFVTPRVTVATGTEVPVPDLEFFAAWPKVVGGQRFALRVSGLGDVNTIVPDDAVAPDEELWHRLFDRTVVGDGSFQDFSEATVHSYPVAVVADAVTELYRTVARTSGGVFPPITRGPLAGAVDDLLLVPPHGEQRRALRARLDGLRNASDPESPGHPGGRFLRIADVPAADRAKVGIAAARMFYDRQDDPFSEAAAADRAPKPKDPEFHSFVARCADFPALLRRLGLAVDLLVEDDPGIPQFCEIEVLPDLAEPPLDALLTPPQARPRTFTRHTDRVWAPSSRELDGDVEDGSLRLERDELTVHQIDPDGAVLKVANLLDSLVRTTEALETSAADNGNRPSTVPDESSLPALRSTGIVISRQDRSADLVQTFDQGASHEKKHAAGQQALLWATDVTRGWRVDILDPAAAPQWRSLHHRDGTYELVEADGSFTPLTEQPGPDEGYLKAASTSSPGVETDKDQYLHETLAGWDGWSLAVSRPGLSVGETHAQEPDAARDVAGTGFPLAVEHSLVPGTLPRLRFGRHYQVRVRAVDLSGRSVPAEQLDDVHELALPTAYQRWDPVPAPIVLPLTEFTEGESLMRLVIRSTDGVSVADYVQLARVKGLPGHQESGRLGIVYRTENERHLAAPSGSVQLAETHGVLDAAYAGNAAGTSAVFSVLAKESGSFLTAPGGRVVNHTDPAGATVLTGNKEQRLAPGEYVVHDAPAIDLPYLPDPLGRGLALQTLPGDPSGSTRTHRWPGDPQTWHDREPVRLVVVDESGALEFDEASRTLTVPLPQGTTWTVRLSSFLDDDDLGLLRIWDLMNQPTAATAADRVQALAGGHWMLTPWADLTLVHAVEKPLLDPVIELDGPSDTPAARRQLGATFSWLEGHVVNDSHSTGRLDLDATWQEPVDDILASAPTVVDKAAHIGDFQLEYEEPAALLMHSEGPPAGPFGPRHKAWHEFGDTLHRWVDYRATATTRYREYFPHEITDDRSLVTRTGPDLASVNVPSSARPAAPDVHSIVPTWTWTEEKVAGGAFGVRRVRSAGGLRVYLGRPWYSSGDDELLGVVLPRQPWLTHVGDLASGVLGDRLTVASAEAAARTALERVDPAAVDVPDPTQVLLSRLTVTPERVADELGRAPAAGRTAEGRFVAEVRRSLGEFEGGLSRQEIDLNHVGVGLGGLLGLLGTTSAEGRRFTSRWGEDPAFLSSPLPGGVYIHQLPMRTRVGYAVPLAEVDGQTVTVVGHQPQYDLDRRLWYCDVQLDAGAAYTPMVQLALARYQPYSVSGVEISPVVLTDYVQLLPQRTSSFHVPEDRGTVVVSLAGPVGIPATAPHGFSTAAQAGATRRVQAWVELLRPDAVSDLEWQRWGPAVDLDVTYPWAKWFVSDTVSASWMGSVPLPPAGSGRVRVQLVEFELHPSDDGEPSVPSASSVAARPVFADTVELPD